ncbi:MAG: hypothetical protein EB090_06000, partial [Verrucomicrobia bacterium]|nr:hypothetical protein [Verrucomicrobiota bacterium]
ANSLTEDAIRASVLEIGRKGDAATEAGKISVTADLGTGPSFSSLMQTLHLKTGGAVEDSGLVSGGAPSVIQMNLTGTSGSGSLAVESGGAIALVGDVTTFAANATANNNIRFFSLNPAGLSIGLADGVAGILAKTVFLDVEGQLAQASGGVITATGGGLALQATGPIRLDQANLFNLVAADAGLNPVYLRSTGTMTVTQFGPGQPGGIPDAVSGITGSNVTLVSGGSLLQTDGANITASSSFLGTILSGSDIVLGSAGNDLGDTPALGAFRASGQPGVINNLTLVNRGGVDLGATRVGNIQLTSAGAEWTQAPTVSLPGCPGASAVAIMTIQNIPVANGGSGYLGEPTVNIVDLNNGTGVGAQARAIVDLTPSSAFYGKVTSIQILNGGTGYGLKGAVRVTLVGGNPAVAAQVTDGTVILGLQRVDVQNPGTDYLNSAVTFSVPTGAQGYGATAVAQAASFKSLLGNLSLSTADGSGTLKLSGNTGASVAGTTTLISKQSINVSPYKILNGVTQSDMVLNNFQGVVSVASNGDVNLRNTGALSLGNFSGVSSAGLADLSQPIGGSLMVGSENSITQSSGSSIQVASDAGFYATLGAVSGGRPAGSVVQQLLWRGGEPGGISGDGASGGGHQLGHGGGLRLPDGGDDQKIDDQSGEHHPGNHHGLEWPEFRLGRVDQRQRVGDGDGQRHLGRELQCDGQRRAGKSGRADFRRHREDRDDGRVPRHHHDRLLGGCGAGLHGRQLVLWNAECDGRRRHHGHGTDHRDRSHDLGGRWRPDLGGPSRQQPAGPAAVATSGKIILGNVDLGSGTLDIFAGVEDSTRLAITQAAGQTITAGAVNFYLNEANSDIILPGANSLSGTVTIFNPLHLRNFSLTNGSASAGLIVGLFNATNLNDLTLQYTDSGVSYEIPELTAAGNVVVLAGNGITDGGTVTVAGAATFTTTSAGGNIDLGTLAVTGPVSVNTASASATIINSKALNLGSSVVNGDLTVTANGAITDSGSLTVSGATQLAAGTANNITLDHAGNNFLGPLRILSANDVTLVGGDGIDLGASTVSGNLLVTANAAITDSGLVSVGNQATFSVLLPGGSIDLDQLKVTGAVSVNTGVGGNVTLVNQQALKLGLSNVGGNLLARAALGNLTDSGSVTVNGGATFQTEAAAGSIQLGSLSVAGAISLLTAGPNGNASIVNNQITLLGDSTVNGNLNVTSPGSIFGAGNLAVTGTSSFTAGYSFSPGDLSLMGDNLFQGAVTVVRTFPTGPCRTCLPGFRTWC